MSIYSVEDQFYAAMLADATVAAYLAGPPARLYDANIPQGAKYPCAVYDRISTIRINTHGAPDNANVWHGNTSTSGKTRFQVTVFGDPAAVRPANAARQIAQALIN